MAAYESVRSILAWCTVINLAVLIWWFLAFSMAHDLMYRLHGRWFKLSPETFDAIHYSGMAFYKIMILVFNLVPYLVMRLLP